MSPRGTAARQPVAPYFPHLEERNVRKGFLDNAQHTALANECSTKGLWLRAMFEVGSNFGWRVDELLKMRVRQVDLGSRTIRLEAGTTKNGEARTVVMTTSVYALIQQCIAGKNGDDYVFTRADGKPIRDFRGVWYAVCCRVGLGRMVCRDCHNAGRDAAVCSVNPAGQCSNCNRKLTKKQQKYVGLIFHDLRRTAVRNMVRSGIPERVAMTISGHKTRAVFDRYNIVSESELKTAAQKLEAASDAIARDYSHSSDIVEPKNATVANVRVIN